MREILLFILLALFHGPGFSHAAAIHDAAKEGDIAALATALDAGANVNDFDGIGTPLFHAVNRQHLNAAKLLIEHGADVNADSTFGGPPVMAATARNRLELIELLITHGANPNVIVSKQTPLHVAVKHGCLECVTALVEAGADVNARTTDDAGRTPIHLAKFYEFSEITDYLMGHGVVVPKPLPIATKLASADVEKGRVFFGGHCDGCHNTERDKGHKSGPNLWGVVGREKASAPKFKYSKTLQDWEGVWTYEDLNILLFDPVLTTPGIHVMEIPGVSDEAERASLIAYLRTLNEQPIPLP